MPLRTSKQQDEYQAANALIKSATLLQNSLIGVNGSLSPSLTPKEQEEAIIKSRQEVKSAYLFWLDTWRKP